MVTLEDSFLLTGTSKDFDVFRNSTREMTEITSILPNKKMWECCFLSKCDMTAEELSQLLNKDADEFKDKVVVYDLSPSVLDAFIRKRKPLRLGTIKLSEFEPGIIKECFDTTQLLLLIDGDKYVLGKSALSRLLRMASIGGTSTRKGSSLIRNMHIAETYANKCNPENGNTKVSMIIRQVNDTRKIFLCCGSHYPLVDHYAACDAYDKVSEDFEIREWSIDHTFTSLYLDSKNVSFKLGKDTIVPGIVIKLSDTETAMQIALTLRVDNSYVIYDEFHVGHESMESRIDFSDTLVEYINTAFEEKVPEIKELIEKYQKIDIVKDNDPESFEKMSSVLDYTVEKVLKDFPKRRTAQILDMLKDDLMTTDYNLADLLALIITSTERQEKLHEVSMHNLRVAIGEASKNFDAYVKIA